MKKSDCIKIIESKLPDVTEFLNVRARQLLNSGAIDFDKYDSDFVLAKVLLVAALKDCAGEYMRPLLTNEIVEEINNLEHF